MQAYVAFFLKHFWLVLLWHICLHRVGDKTFFIRPINYSFTPSFLPHSLYNLVPIRISRSGISLVSFLLCDPSVFALPGLCSISFFYLVYRVPYGAQLRYFVRHRQPPCPVLACLLFTNAGWKMAPRDHYIGWNDSRRKINLARVVNNSRFLICPWVEIPNLASHILSAAARQLKQDWQSRYAVEPVLLET